MYGTLTKDDDVADALAGAGGVGQHQLVLARVGPLAFADRQHRIPLILINSGPVNDSGRSFRAGNCEPH